MQIKQKMTFESDTDTEVIPKLCMYIYKNLTEPLAFSEVHLLDLHHLQCFRDAAAQFESVCCNLLMLLLRMLSP